MEPLARINRFITTHGAVAGIQLAHAGRKASTWRPWEGKSGQVSDEQGGWLPAGPSALAFQPEKERVPHALGRQEIAGIVDAFAVAARRALGAGYRWLELHGAHGYLAHEFMSPLSNRRTDEYGGTFENRIRLALEITRAVRAVWPENLPLTWRISATDWVEGGWTPADSVQLARQFKKEGVDLVDCSSGGNVPHATIPTGPGYQVQFAEQIRREAGIATAAVGLITEARQADEIIRTGQADLIFWLANSCGILTGRCTPRSNSTPACWLISCRRSTCARSKSVTALGVIGDHRSSLLDIARTITGPLAPQASQDNQVWQFWKSERQP